MKLPGLYSLQSKFILSLITVLMMISIINLTALYFFLQNTMKNEVSTRASIVLEQVDAVKGYVQSTLRPKMLETLTDTFVLEAMSSSFISRAVMEKIGDNNEDYLYRRVAINATNPAFEASSEEAEIIHYFRKNDSAGLWQGKKKMYGQELYILARPVRYTRDCLLCHGDPSDAPVELSLQYGQTGYHHKEDNIDGIDLVGISTAHFAAKNNEKFSLYAIIYLMITCLVIFLIYLTFQRVVVVNMRALTSRFRKNFRDKKGVELLNQVEHGDEIEEMIEGMEDLSLHLYETEQQLKQHTANLEKEVEKRTEQLSIENEKRRRDFNIFVDLLQALQSSTNRAGLWQNVLPLLAGSLKLERASYVCTFSSNQSFTWPPDMENIPLPDNHVSLLIDPQVRIENNEVYIPIGASDDDIEGLLILVRTPEEPFGENELEQLTAIGRQLGIAAENMSALDAILRQSDNLQTIFEGITDPLILMESSGGIIMANNAANQLLETFAEPAVTEQGTLLDQLLADVPHSQTTSREKREERDGTVSREITLDNGRSFVVNTFPLKQNDKADERLVVAIGENTEKKKMVRQVVQSEKMATVGKLAAGLAHELNNPLGVILCYAELIRKSIGAEQLRDDVDVVIKHTKQAQSVLMDLLNFARPKVTTNRETIIGDIIESVIGVFRVQAAKKQVQLNCTRNDGNRPVHIEQQAAEHIILNLLINALDAIEEPPGTIDVALHYNQETAQVVLTVKDSGTGIPADIMPQIFDPFFTTKDISEGTGLGLAMIYGYMYELGGTIEAANHPDGALFTLNFPAAGV